LGHWTDSGLTNAKRKLFSKEFDGALPQTPGFIALVPIPKRGTANDTPPASVLAPGAALGSLPSVALFSVQAVGMITEFLKFSLEEDH
jgi:hypothetical protein